MFTDTLVAFDDWLVEHGNALAIRLRIAGEGCPSARPGGLGRLGSTELGTIGSP